MGKKVILVTPLIQADLLQTIQLLRKFAHVRKRNIELVEKVISNLDKYDGMKLRMKYEIRLARKLAKRWKDRYNRTKDKV